MRPRLPLQAQTPERLARALGVPEEDARRVVSCLHRGGDPYAPSSGVRRTSREAVVAGTFVPSLRVVDAAASALDPFQKLVLEAEDGERFETVRIPLERAGRYSVCVSSQVGCALACAFCATGKLGLRRNLATWEIVEQVRLVRQGLAGTPGARVHGVVFQGMGEPLANLDRVLEAIEVLSCPSGPAIDRKAITVCTSGLPAGIRRLADEAPNVRLGVSLASARRDVRRSLMPIEASHALDEVLEAAAYHVAASGQSPMFAVTPLAGVSDTDADADALADVVRGFAERTGKRPRLSLVPYNPVPGDPFERTGEARFAAFRARLAERGVHAHVRYSGGSDVAAACGQLASVAEGGGEGRRAARAKDVAAGAR